MLDGWSTGGDATSEVVARGWEALPFGNTVSSTEDDPERGLGNVIGMNESKDSCC